MAKKSTARAAEPVEASPRFDPRAFVENTAAFASAVRDVLTSSPYALASSTARGLNGAVKALQADAEMIAAEMRGGVAAYDAPAPDAPVTPAAAAAAAAPNAEPAPASTGDASANSSANSSSANAAAAASDANANGVSGAANANASATSAPATAAK